MSLLPTPGRAASGRVRDFSFSGAQGMDRNCGEWRISFSFNPLAEPLNLWSAKNETLCHRAGELKLLGESRSHLHDTVCPRKGTAVLDILLEPLPGDRILPWRILTGSELFIKPASGFQARLKTQSSLFYFPSQILSNNVQLAHHSFCHKIR